MPFSFGDNPNNAGDKVQVGCTVAKGDQPLRISWNFYGEELSSNMGVSTMAVGDSMNVLFIPFVAPSNRGNYTCVAKNSAGHDSYTAQLLVNGIHYTKSELQFIYLYIYIIMLCNNPQSISILSSLNE